MQRISRAAPKLTRPVGRAGYLARAVVFAVIGWSLFDSGVLAGGSERVKTLAEAVASLAGQGVLFTLVAIGMLAFGVLSLILARYRIIPPINVSGKIAGFRH